METVQEQAFDPGAASLGAITSEVKSLGAVQICFYGSEVWVHTLMERRKKKKTFLLLCVFSSTEAGRIAGHVRPHSAHFQPYLVQTWPVFSRGLTNRLLMKFVILFFFSFLVILSKKQPESSRWASHLLPYFQTLSPPLPQTNSDRLTVTDHSAANRLHHHKWGGGGGRKLPPRFNLKSLWLSTVKLWRFFFFAKSQKVF